MLLLLLLLNPPVSMSGGSLSEILLYSTCMIKYGFKTTKGLSVNQHDDMSCGKEMSVAYTNHHRGTIDYMVILSVSARRG